MNYCDDSDRSHRYNEQLRVHIKNSIQRLSIIFILKFHFYYILVCEIVLVISTWYQFSPNPLCCSYFIGQITLTKERPPKNGRYISLTYH